MSIVADTYGYVMGVDTHAQSHTYVIVKAATGAVVGGPTKFPTTEAGIRRAVNWCLKTTGGPASLLAAVEGSACYGRLLSQQLLATGIEVCEVRPPRRGGAKSDALDADGAARIVLRCHVEDLTGLRASGLREVLAIEQSARRAMTKTVTADHQRLITLMRRYDLGIDARRGLGKPKIVAISRWRRRPTEPLLTQHVRAEAVRLATAILAGHRELAANARVLSRLVRQLAPGLLELPGVGPVSGAAVLISYSHKGRIRTEAKWARHIGVAPIPAGSGKTDGRLFRLNSGNDRQANAGIYWIVQARMRSYEPTRDYVAKQHAAKKPDGKIRRSLQRYAARDIYRFLESLNIQGTPLTT